MANGKSLPVEIAEFESLRQEINTRLTVSYTLLALDLAALGAGLSVAEKNSHVLGGLAVLAGVMWLFWAQNSSMIQSLGVYIALDLGPRMSSAVGRPVLGWEVFLRRLLVGGASASELLFGDDSYANSRGLRWVAGSDWYTTVLFGGSSPVLLAAYIWINRHASAEAWVLVGLIGSLGVAVWLYGAISFNRFMNALDLFTKAVLMRGTPPPEE